MATMLEYAGMAEAAYWEKPKFEGWHVIDFWPSGKGLSEAFQGVAFGRGRELVYAFKGTDLDRFETSSRDIMADEKLWLGMNTAQYDKAMQFLRRLKSPPGTQITLCG